MKLEIKQILNYASSQLQESGSQSPLLDAEVLLSFILDEDRSYLFMYPKKEIPLSVYYNYLSLIEARKKGKPIPYITGNQEFMKLDFFVNESVLIPRPDTEILVESIIETVKKTHKRMNILDLGCGSGALSVSLAYYLPDVVVCGIDISSEAVKVARKNALRHGVHRRIDFLCGDLFEPVKDSFDIIVSNPPYIPSKDMVSLQVEVSNFEPRQALDGGEDGLKFYRRIGTESPKYIKSSGHLFLEIGYNQAPDVCSLLAERNEYSNIVVFKDLAGRNRVVKAEVRSKV